MSSASARIHGAGNTSTNIRGRTAANSICTRSARTSRSVGRNPMPTSATGIWSSRLPVQRGFTLIEILVVMLIIGIMVAGTVLSVGLAHGDRELEKERDRLLALTDFVREQGAMQNR